MKATELRIGNLIRMQEGVFRSPKGDFVTVDCIEDTPRIGVRESPPLWGYFAEDEIEPIPLTEEWLLKFGFFKLNRDVPAFELKKLIVEWLFERWTGRLYADAFTSIQIIELKYVHQLQNLYFALTGNELTINQ